jgi:phenylacetate-CoA ligase
VYDWYGVADTGIIAAEGPDRDGLHVWEDAHHVEVLDPETHAPRPDGEAGSLCVTVLFKDGVAPLVRFDTQDVSAFLPGPSASAIGLRRLRGFQGRSDQMVKLRGINVYPTAIGAHLREHPAVTGEYVCRLERRGLRDELTVVVEVRPGAADPAAVRRELEALLRGKLGVEVGVLLAGPGETAGLTQIEARQKPIRLVTS